MDYHYNARLTIVRREQLAQRVLDGSLSLNSAMAEFKLSRQTAAKWVRRYKDHGVAGLKDRSSRPHRSPRGTPEEKIMELEQLRRQRWTGVRIAQHLQLSRATVSRVLRRLKLNRIRDIEPRLPPNRYEHAAPGDMLHLDIKRLVRIQRPSHRVTGDRRDGVKGIGAEFLHVAIDDHSRIAFTAMYPDQTEASSTHFSPPRWPGIKLSASPSAACSPTTGLATRRTASAKPARNSTSSTGEPDPTPHARTARQNASSKPPSMNGPMPSPSRTQPIEQPLYRHGPTNTTGTDRTPASTKIHPSPD